MSPRNRHNSRVIMTVLGFLSLILSSCDFAELKMSEDEYLEQKFNLPPLLKLQQSRQITSQEAWFHFKAEAGKVYGLLRENCPATKISIYLEDRKTAITSNNKKIERFPIKMDTATTLFIKVDCPVEWVLNPTLTLFTASNLDEEISVPDVSGMENQSVLCFLLPSKTYLDIAKGSFGAERVLLFHDPNTFTPTTFDTPVLEWIDANQATGSDTFACRAIAIKTLPTTGKWLDDGLPDEGSINWYRFEAAANTTYLINMNDAQDGDGTKTASPVLLFDYGPDTPSNEHSALFTTGHELRFSTKTEVMVKACLSESTYYTDTPGSYAVKVQALTDPELVIGTPVIAAKTVFRHGLWYRVKLLAEEWYSIRLFNYSSSSLDQTISIPGSLDEKPCPDYFSFANDTEIFLNISTYYGSIETFDLLATKLSTPELIAGTAIDGNISTAGTKHYYRMAVEAGKSYTLKSNGRWLSKGKTLWEDISIITTDGKYLVREYTSSTTNTGQLFVAPTDGFCLLQVTGYDSFTGTYAVSYEETP